MASGGASDPAVPIATTDVTSVAAACHGGHPDVGGFRTLDEPGPGERSGADEQI
jgi:hypothetical protein